MTTTIKSAVLRHVYSGSLRLDVTALAKLIVTVARLLEGERRIAELDLNPVILYPEGQGVKALDALMLVGDAGA